MKVGIVGMPNAGKSSLFNALTQAGAEAANYPFTTIEPNVAVVPVRDERLDAVAQTVGASNIVPDTIDFHDIAGLVAGAHKGEGLGNQFLANIRETDALVHVVRAHTDANVIHPEGLVDPVRDAETIETELIFADLEQAERRHQRVVRQARGGDKAAIAEEAWLRDLIAASPSSTLATKSTGLAVSGDRSRMAFGAASGGGTVRAGRPSCSAAMSSRSHASSAIAALSPPRAWRTTRWWRRSACSRSAKISSVSIVSASRTGSTNPSGWMTLSSVCTRTTWTIASVSRMFPRNWLPRPSPSCAPRTRPAMSWKAMVSGTSSEAPTVSATASRRGSRTGTMATLGSIVVNG